MNEQIEAWRNGGTPPPPRLVSRPSSCVSPRHETSAQRMRERKLGRIT